MHTSLKRFKDHLNRPAGPQRHRRDRHAAALCHHHLCGGSGAVRRPNPPALQARNGRAGWTTEGAAVGGALYRCRFHIGRLPISEIHHGADELPDLCDRHPNRRALRVVSGDHPRFLDARCPAPSLEAALARRPHQIRLPGRSGHRPLLELPHADQPRNGRRPRCICGKTPKPCSNCRASPTPETGLVCLTHPLTGFYLPPGWHGSAATGYGTNASTPARLRLVSAKFRFAQPAGPGHPGRTTSRRIAC